MKKRPTTKHALARSSPKGTKFFGTCMSCGKEGLTLEDMETSVCLNPRGYTQEEVVLMAMPQWGKFFRNARRYRNGEASDQHNA